MKNKKLIIGITIAAVLIAAVIIIMVAKAKKAGALTSGNVNNPGTAGSTGISDDTGSIKQPSVLDKVTTTVSNWWDDIFGTAPKTITYSPSVFPLKYGSEGDEVRELQLWLNYHLIIPYAPLNDDGVWGDKTDAAVRRTLNVTEVTEAWFKSNILKQTM